MCEHMCVFVCMRVRWGVLRCPTNQGRSREVKTANLIPVLAKAQRNTDPVIISLERKRAEKRRGGTEERMFIVYSLLRPVVMLPCCLPVTHSLNSTIIYTPKQLPLTIWCLYTFCAKMCKTGMNWAKLVSRSFFCQTFLVNDTHLTPKSITVHQDHSFIMEFDILERIIFPEFKGTGFSFY